MWNKTLKVLLLLVIFLNLSSIAQEPEKKKEKQSPIVIDTMTYVSERKPDSLYLEQISINMKLDSLLLEKQKKR